MKFIGDLEMKPKKKFEKYLNNTKKQSKLVKLQTFLTNYMMQNFLDTL